MDTSVRKREVSKFNFRFQVICFLKWMRKAGKRASLEVKSIFQYFFFAYVKIKMSSIQPNIFQSAFGVQRSWYWSSSFGSYWHKEIIYSHGSK